MNTEILHVTPTTAHRAKVAYVYVRQSSLMQVTRHAESTDLQYSLVERAKALGWPRERIEIIDEDLGKSGADRKSTRLNSSHQIISYAVFCLKKKNYSIDNPHPQ